MMTLYKRLSIEAVKNNLTEVNLAKEMNMSKVTLNKIKNGYKPSLSTYYKISKFLNEDAETVLNYPLK